MRRLEKYILCRKNCWKKGKISYNENCYLSSLEPNAEKLLKIARGHLKVKSMHWLLGVVMNEDIREIQS